MIKELVKTKTSDFGLKDIKDSPFNPCKEYFALNQKRKSCYIIRCIENKLYVLDLKSTVKLEFPVEEFENLLDTHTILELEYKEVRDGNEQKETNQARKEMFMYLIDNGYFD